MQHCILTAALCLSLAATAEPPASPVAEPRTPAAAQAPAHDLAPETAPDLRIAELPRAAPGPTLPLAATGRNPACRVTRWGLKALTFATTVACCAGGLVACVVCTVGFDTVMDGIKAIDCSKRCRPDCPLA